MNLSLPFNLFYGLEFIFSNPVNLILIGCFTIPSLILIYYFVVVSKRDGAFPEILNKRPTLFNKTALDLEESEEESTGIERNAYDEALRILDRARSDSLKILGKAQSKAQGILNSTYIISRESRKKLEDNIKNIYEKQQTSLSNISEELLEYYRDAIEEGKKENIRTLYEVTEAMREEAIQGVKELKDVVKKETMEAQDALEEKITTEYAKVDTEIKDYRSKKIESLNKKIFELLSNIHTEVIREDLDQIKHEKLILELLDREIKKSGLSNLK